jgi:capsule polysaccharide export protein KpsE/RkpR
VKQKELEKLADSVRTLQNKYGIYSVTQQGEVFASELALAQGEVMRNRGRLEVLSDNPLIPKDTVEYIRANLRAGERTLQRLYKAGNYGDNFSVSNYNEGLPQVALVNDLHYQARRQLSYDVERYHQIRSAYNTDIPAIQLISVAERPIMKIRPKRTVLVVASTVAVFLFTLLAALLADAYRDVNWKKLAADSEN